MKSIAILVLASLSQAATVSLALPAAPAQTSCAEVQLGWGARGVSQAFGAQIVDQVVFDDGSGPALFACGEFEAAGAAAASKLAKWDGQRWTGVGAPPGVTLTTGALKALAVYDDGSGPALYVGGFFHTIGAVAAANLARWDGSNWSAVGGGYARAVNDLVAFDDGGGVQLYVAGDGFTGSGGAWGAIVSRWNGVSWSTPGGIEPSPDARTLCVHDDGAGPALYVGGQINSLGAAAARNLVRWDGVAWSAVGGGANGRVLALAEHDDGGGNALFVGGEFTEVGGAAGFERIARWRGGAWSPLAAGVSGPVRALESFDDGGGLALFAAGQFIYAAGAPANHIARWRAGAWSSLGVAAVGLFPPGDSSVVAHASSLLVHDDGSGVGPALFVGGSFGAAGDVRAASVARWSSAGWSAAVDERGAEGADARVEVLAAVDLGAGEELYVGGAFRGVGAVATSGLGKGDGAHWSPSFQVDMPNGVVRAILAHDDGSGRALYVGGNIVTVAGQFARGVARWDGTQWSALPGGPDNGEVYALASFDDGGGPALWVAGTFTSVGGATARRIARWRSGAWWTPATGPTGAVFALAVHDDGSGPALYCGGAFLKVGALFTFGAARWNGASWSTVGGGFSSAVRTFAVLDLGGGPELYAGGDFDDAPPQVVHHVARWDGAQWQPLGQGFDASVTALGAFDDGSGPALLAGGDFGQSGATSTRHLARWDGAEWTEVGGGVDRRVTSMVSFRPPGASRAKLYIGGQFSRAGALAASRVAALDLECPCPPNSYCTSGVSANGCVPSMQWAGTPSASGATPFTISAAGVDGQRLGVLFYGASGRASSPWGATSSFLCVKAPLQRTGQGSSGGTAGACDGVLSLDWNSYLAANPAALGAPFQAGERVWIQGWYRDPPSVKTTALTSALEFLLCP